MRVRYIFFLMAVLLGITMASCENDDYANDGGKSQRYVDMTTYDFLKSHGKFDSLVAIIDRAGLKDMVNEPNTTLYASTDYSVAPYVLAKKQKRVIETGNENIQFGINDISIRELDSLKMYLFEGAHIREYLTRDNKYFTSRFGAMNNSRFLVKLRRVIEYTDYVDYVDYVNFTRVIGELDSELGPDAILLPQDVDMSYDCQTAGIITKTGVVNVLIDGHRLMFNRESVGQ